MEIQLGYLVLAVVASFVAFSLIALPFVFGMLLIKIFEEGVNLLSLLVGGLSLIFIGLYGWGCYGVVLLWRIGLGLG